jgi:hypothetical protein
MTTSPGQPRCTSLVIIASQRRPCAVCRSPEAMTKAGRRCRTGRSVYGNGTLTMSQGSKFAISPLIGLRRPLVEGHERIIAWSPIALLQDDPVSLNGVDKFVPRFQAERGSHGSGDCRLCFAGQLAGNHCSVSEATVPGRCKEFPYLRQGTGYLSVDRVRPVEHGAASNANSFVAGLDPAIHDSREPIVKIVPVGILRENQVDFPRPSPVLHIPFTLPCQAHVIIAFHKNQPL